MATIVYPGTFDPITFGHLDVIRRASKLFTKVVVAVARNTQKQPLFTLEQRVHLCRRAIEAENYPVTVQVEGFERLLIEFIRAQQAGYILRGMRAVSDFELEFQLASANRSLAPDIESLFIIPDTKFAFISSSLVREVAMHYGEVRSFVPELVALELERKFPRDRRA